MDARQALAPVEFRFTDPRDVEKYGDRWYRYAEADLIRLPARELITLEGMLGMPIVDVMNGMRMATVLGDTASAWLGVRQTDPSLAGTFDEFDPITLLIQWRKWRDEGKGEATTEVAETPTESATPEPPADNSPLPGRSQSVTLDPRDTHVLSTLPITE